MHQVAQKSTTTTCPGKLLGPRLRPSTVGNWKPKSTLAAGAGLSGVAFAAALPAFAPFLQLSRKRAITAATRTGRRERNAREKVVMVSTSRESWPGKDTG